MIPEEEIRKAKVYTRSGNYFVPNTRVGDTLQPEAEGTPNSTHAIEGTLGGIVVFHDLPATPYGIFITTSFLAGVDDTPPTICLALTEAEAKEVIGAIVGATSYAAFREGNRLRFYLAPITGELEVSLYRKSKGYLIRDILKAKPLENALLLTGAIIYINLRLPE